MGRFSHYSKVAILGFGKNIFVTRKIRSQIIYSPILYLVPVNEQTLYMCLCCHWKLGRRKDHSSNFQFYDGKNVNSKALPCSYLHKSVTYSNFMPLQNYWRQHLQWEMVTAFAKGHKLLILITVLYSMQIKSQPKTFIIYIP